MRRCIERLEHRELLAGDVQLEYGAATEPDEFGAITRQIRVYASAEGAVRVESSLTDEFVNPRSEVSYGFSNKTMDLGFLPDSPDLRMEGVTLLQDVGDLNGDGRDDFLHDEDSRAIVIYGGLSKDFDVSQVTANSDDRFVIEKDLGTPVSYLPTRYSNLGDVDGDGFNELAIEHHYQSGGDRLVATRIFWGSDANATQPTNSLSTLTSFPSARSVGDVNGDGFDDVFVRQPPQRDSSSVVVGHVFYGGPELANDFATNDFSPEQMIAAGKGFAFTKSGAEFGTFAESADTIGDLNNDGFDDFMLGRARPYLIFGGSNVAGQTSISLDSLSSLRAGGETGWVSAGAQVGGIGDVNGDGLDDVLISFDGGDCQLCTATDRDNNDTTGGGLILYGGTDVGGRGTFDPETDPHTSLKFATVTSSARPRAELHDVNGDGLMDVHLSAEFRGQGPVHVVIAGREGLILPHQDLGHTFDCCDDLVDGESAFAFQVPNSIDPASRDFQYVDVNADGIADALTSRRVYFGSTQPSLVQVEGDIQETIQLDPYSSAIFTVRGVPKESGEQATTIAVPTSGIDFNLTNNVESTRASVSLSVALEMNEDISVGEELDARVTITNSGPSNAVVAQLVDSVFRESIQNESMNWALSEYPFPPELDLRQTNGIFVASIPAPQRARFHEVASSSYLNTENLFTHLGNSLASTDFNEDGFDDLVVHFKHMQNPGPWCFTCLPAGALVFEGSPTFGSDGQFPTPATESAPETSDDEITGDFNGDGLPDLIVQKNSQTVEVRYGTTSDIPDTGELDGGNGFVVATSTTEVSSFDFGDLNGDGFDDLIIGDASRNEIDDGAFQWFPPSAFEELNNAFYDSDRMVHVIYGTDNPISEGAFELNSIDGRNGFRMILQGSAKGSRTEVLSDFDVNGDGVDDLLIGDPNAGILMLGELAPGAIYVVFGRTSVDALGVGTLPETINVQAGSTIEIEVRGILAKPLSGSIEIEPAADQFELYPETNSVVIDDDEAPSLISDLTGDGFVNFDDFLILSANFGAEVSSQDEGDIDGDGTVTFADFLLLNSEFARQTP